MTLKEIVDTTVRGYLYRTLSDCGGNVSKAAKRAGCSRQTFYKMMHRYGIVSGKMKRGDAPGSKRVQRAFTVGEAFMT